ncbi:YdcF family protein [Streptococcus suis]|uniref:YdcF family protein n=1 Tax=Streptococcus suis TaxID=1307 RepID=UPI000428AFA7|nr:YdcF family protein [Streptococcus suis]MBM7178897.1 YdcF family protein [Streptococcus suis]MBS8085889.1 YdcF family protein [Streptococcus suis]HEL1647876.1 YdcF family protein [Streptococcus suis]HEM6036162.1 YdcF family protein [Streptococcus suis]HEM6053302.1 YdcF family protein [Streptococcus suis]
MILAQAVNQLVQFCGLRDLSSLTIQALQTEQGLEQVDVLAFFGGSILAGGDQLAEAIRNKLAKIYVIVGGAGHTTAGLRQQVRDHFPQLDPTGLTEAEIFQAYLGQKYGLSADLLEISSTNCGNNVTYLLDLLAEKGIDFQSILLMQDAAMQRRMWATMKKYAADKLLLNYASYQVTVREENDQLQFDNAPFGMWDMDRYLSLLLGEIPRLRDDEEGYGPRGANYLAHIDIPQAVEESYQLVQERTGLASRKANPKFASPE